MNSYSRRFICKHCRHKGRVSVQARARYITCPSCKKTTQANKMKKPTHPTKTATYSMFYTDYAGSWYKIVVHKERPPRVVIYVSLDSHSPYRKVDPKTLDETLKVKIKQLLKSK